MSQLNTSIKNEYVVNDAPPPSIETDNGEIYYNCSECSSLIEIISINVNNNIIEFNCLNKENNHKNIIIPLKEYLEKMKKYNNRALNCDECKIHNKNNKYVSYCFNCNRHLCEECLKTRNHMNHIKNNIIEIKPINEELDIIKEVINDYKNQIENLMKEKQNKINELNKSLNQNKKFENTKIDEKIKMNEKIKEEELRLNHDKYSEDINEIIKRYENEINLRKLKYINDNNKINNKYKLINEKEFIIHKFKINELEKKFNEEIKNLKYNEKIEKINNIKELNELIYNTYNTYNNNYYNALNINSILLSYINNEYIKDKIMKRILKNKYDEIYDLIQRKKKDDIDINKKKENIKNENDDEELLKSSSSNKNKAICFKCENKIKKMENDLSVLKMEIDEKDEEIKKYKEEFNKMKDNYEKNLKILKEENINNIKKFENYLKILDKRINYVDNEISIIYKINKNENYVKM